MKESGNRFEPEICWIEMFSEVRLTSSQMRGGGPSLQSQGGYQEQNTITRSRLTEIFMNMVIVMTHSTPAIVGVGPSVV